jgi:hypothetical protein
MNVIPVLPSKRSLTEFDCYPISVTKPNPSVVCRLADLVVTPIGRFVFGKAIKKDFEIVKSKSRRNRECENYGYGLVVLPKHD